MSRGAPPTQMLSAVPNQVNQNIAAGGQMNLQQQQINNQAAAQRQQAELQRQQMQQERVLSEEALRQRSMESLLQAENYEKLNASNMQIARERNMQAEATRRQQAQIAQADRDMQMQIHQQTMAADKEAKALQIQIALAQSETGTPEDLEALRQAEARMVDLGMRLDAANKIQAGQVRNFEEYRNQAAVAMRDTVENMDRAFDQVTAELPEYTTAIDYTKYFGDPYEDGFISAGASGAAEAGYTFMNLFGAGMAGQRDYRALLTIKDDPDAARAANLQYHADLVQRAVESAFPQANNPNAIAASWMGLSGSLEGLSSERKEAAVQQFLGELQQSGVDPLMFGELMRRVDASTQKRLDELRQQGITPNLPKVDAEQSGDFITSHLLRTTPGHRMAVALLPTVNPMRTYLDTLDSPDITLDQVEAMIQGMGRRGMEVDPQLQGLSDLLEELQGTREDIVDIQRQTGLEEAGIERMGTDIEMRAQERSRRRLEEIAQGLL